MILKGFGCVMTELVTPEEVQELLENDYYGYRVHRLCRDYLTLWERNKELEALILKRLIQRVDGTETQ